MNLGDFTTNEHPSLGIELELALVDARHMGLRSAIDDVLTTLPVAAAERAKGEFLRCYVELDTHVCRDVAEAGRDLERTLGAVEAAADRIGVALWWGGTHPFSRWRDQEITPDPRYLELAEEYQEVVRRPVTFGLHVHVGVASGDAAIAAMNRLAEHLPILLALSANSPFWQGRATGMHSHRIDLLEGIPTGGLPPAPSRLGRIRRDRRIVHAVGVHQEPEGTLVGRPPEPAVRHGRGADLRHAGRPRLGAGTDGVDTMPGGRARLVAGRVRGACEARGLAIRQNRWLARRYGLGARLADMEEGTPIPVRDLAKRLVDRLMPTADSLGCAAELAGVVELVDRPSGAERQLGVLAETGDLVEVVRRGVAAARVPESVLAGGVFDAMPLIGPPTLGLAPLQP